VFLGLSMADLAQCKEAIPLLTEHFNEELEQKLRRVAGLSLLSCEASLSRTDDALDVARQLTRWYPGDEDVLYQTAELYSQLSRKSVNDLLHDHPDSYRIHQLAGEALDSQNNDKQALIEYRKALEVNPRAPHTHYRIGEILLRNKQAPGGEAEALKQFQQEIAVNPGDTASEYAVAEILRGRNELPSARLHFERALQLNPSFVEAHIGLAKLSASEHNPEQALAHAQRAVELSPQDAAAHYALMVIYRDLGKIEDAKRELALVEDLNAKKESDFRANLQMLLTGQRSSH
jgi:tetratricopeptide (TPR) repeat protein